jgi:hypothetical protein
MGQLAVWRVLDEMVMEFRQRGLTVPQNVMDDLKSALTMMKIGDVDKSMGETAPKIEEYLSNVESYLITEAQKRYETKYIDEWLRRIDEAGYETCGTCNTCETEKKQESRFVSGLPRDQKWVRVEPTELPIETLKELANQADLSSRTEKDGHLLVFGKDEDVKNFIKKMASYITSQRTQENKRT